MKKLILLLLFIPLVSFGQEMKESFQTENGVLISFKKPNGVTKYEGNATNNPYAVAIYNFTNDITSNFSINAKPVALKGQTELNNMNKEDIYKSLAEAYNRTPDGAGIKTKLIEFSTVKINDKLFGEAIVEINLIYKGSYYFFYTKNTIISITGTSLKSNYNNFYPRFLDFVNSIEIK
tara:strand:- start:1581 stop:2114 length:534 start_codon:yes stop_codon:yes gene_type:complete